ncbi:hypothetical protein [Corynebacterium urealyticum]|uniref:hypothetical protein n=1 Tax=Corynebacterium urealyticum TaxID=43771 RepID=UPI0021CC9290|nr:hypothetical protein [Corynebacterium urealyticum]
MGWAVIGAEAVPDGATVPEEDVVAAPELALDDDADGADGSVSEAFSDVDAERILTLLEVIMGAPVDHSHRGGRVPGRSF